MTNQTSEELSKALDEILTDLADGEAAEEAWVDAKQEILDWHNKQIEGTMAKFSLKKGVKYDVKATDSVIVITPANKLKEAEL